MATIDDKVVAMSFESSKFESGVHSTISALDKLKSALHFPNAGKGLDEINAASKRVDLSHIGNAVEGVKSKLESLRLVAIGVMAQLATQAIRAGGTLLKSFTIGPAIAGFHEYATNLNSIQTILANTQASGADLQDVNAALDELNTYSDKTIYNFSQMARNIGTFTAAGVDLDTSTQAIKGIANLAALSGSNADQASTAMYQLSQAISAGRVGLQDWNSVVNAGMGGTVFQRALATTAENMGTLKEGTLKLVGPMKNVEISGQSFRQSMQAGPGKQSWLTSKVLTTTLKQFTGDLSNAELKAQGFNAAQIKAIQQTAKTAQHAATEVKTISQVLDVAKETAGSGWSATFRTIFGDFEEAKSTFTDLSNTINGFINTNADARNKVLGDWKALGGRTVLIDSIKTAFHNLGLILAPIKEAFREIFPPKTGHDLMQLTFQFQMLAMALKPSKETVDNLKRTFKGLFALMDIGKQIIKGIFTMFGRLFGAVSDGQGGFLEFTATIGDWLVKLDEALKKGDVFNNFFSGLGDILAVPIKLLERLGHAIGDLFGGFDSGGISDKMGGMTKAMTPFQKVLEAISKAWDNFINSLDSANIGQAAVDGLIKVFEGLGPAIANAIGSFNWDTFLAIVRTGLFGGLVLMFKQFLGKGSFLNQISKGFGKGIIGNISSSFDSLSGSMKAMQTNLKAKTLKEIAIAILLLTISVVALSFIDAEGLKKAIVAMGFMFAELLTAMKILDAMAASKGFLKIPLIAGSLIFLAGAIDLLVIAVVALSKLSWEELAKGLGGVGALLFGISLAVKPMSANSAGMIQAGIGIGAIAIAMNLLALAMKQMAGMSWQELIKGLVGVGGALVAMSRTVGKMPATGMIQMGLGIIALAAGLKIMASAMKDFAKMSWKDIGKGLVAVGGALIVIAGAMKLMPGGMILTGVGLIAVAYALGLMGDALAQMGGMSIKEIAKGIGTLALTLSLLDAALYSMTGSIGGAVALTIAAVGITLLAKALQTMAQMSPREIITSLIVLAGALIVLGVAAALIGPVAPALLAMGAAIFLIGAGFALAGAGIFLLSAGLSALAISGPAGIHVLITALNELILAIPEMAKNFILGILAIVDQLAATAPKFVDAIIKIVSSLVDAIIRLTPKFEEAFDVLLAAALRILHDNLPKILKAGFELITQLLNGIKKNMPQFVSTIVDIIVKFVSTLGSNIGKIVTAGVTLLVNFVKGIGSNIGKIATAVIEIIAKFLSTVASNLGDIVDAGVDILVSFIEGVTKNISDLITTGTQFIITLIQGIEQAGEDIIRAGTDAMIKFMNALVEESLKLVDAGATAIVNFLNGVADAIDEHAHEMRAAGVRVAAALINGMTGGLTSKAKELYDKISGVMHHAMGLWHSIPGVKSPSTVTTRIGKYIILGLVKGIDDHAPKAYKSITVMSEGVIKATKKIFGIASPSKVMQEIGQAVGEGFAEGLKGSQDDIRNAFKDLNSKLKDEMQNAKETIDTETDNLYDAIIDTFEKQAKLDKLRKEKKPDKEAIASALNDLKKSQAKIREIQAVIVTNEDILRRTTAGHNALVKTLGDEKKALIVASGEYDRISKKLEDNIQKLDDIKQKRKDLVTSTTDQYSVLPEISTLTPEEIAAARKARDDAAANLEKLLSANEQDADAITEARASAKEEQANLDELLKGKILDATGKSVDLLATYQSDLKARTATVAAYNLTLEKLRASGIDDATYTKLVEDGTIDQGFANQLAQGGEKAVTRLKGLDTNLIAEAKKIGVNTGDQMFKQGQKIQQRIVDGLRDDKHDAAVEVRKIGHKIMKSLKDAISEDKAGVGDEMESVGKEMVTRMKKALGMKSPSREMIEIGRMSLEGLSLGLTDNTHLISNAADQVAKDALTAMQRSMQSIHSAVTDELDTNPVITPVLDLTQIRGQSRELANMIPITAAASYGQASLISSQQTAAQAEGSDVALAGGVVKFEQNNYSPTALSEIDIYRQTKNQLSQLKSALAIT